MSELAILVPVLGRAHQIEPLLNSIAENTDVDYRVVFICSPDDTEARETCLASEADTITVHWEPDRADFAKKVNLAFETVEEEWLFQGATDLLFQEKWASRALAIGDKRRVGVVGTNDLGNPLVKRGAHSTHTFFSRSYIEHFGGTFDGSGSVFSVEYDHEFVDTEFIQTAILRRQFQASPRSFVEHLHPHWGKGEMDTTYEKATRGFLDDARIYNARMKICKLQLGQRPGVRGR